MYTTDIEELIKIRRSTRSFNNDVISRHCINELTAFMNNYNNSNYRFLILDTNELEGVKFGTYGFIRNAKSYIIALANDHIVEDIETTIQFGYDFEHIILKATDLGLSTCWLGMAFKEDVKYSIPGVKSHERIIMVSPIGYTTKQGINDKVIRFVAKSNKRQAFDDLFKSEDNKKIVRYLQNDYKNVLEMVRFAPSAGNSQPWRIVQTNDGYDFYIQSKKYYDNLKNKRIDFGYNDLGIAKCHFQLVAAKYNLKGDWIKDKNKDNRDYLFTWSITLND